MSDIDKITVTALQLEAVLRKALPVKKVIGIYGPPGVGKSSIPVQVAATLEMESLVMFGAVKESVDFGGYPVRSTIKVTEDRDDLIMQLVPSHDLYKIQNAKKDLVVIFDEIDKCDTSVMNAIAQIILSRTINGELISEHVRFVLTGNRLEDKAGGKNQPEQLKSRQCLLELEPDIASWVQWAVKAGVPLEIIGFFKMLPDLLYNGTPSRDLVNTCNPRAAVTLGESLKNNLILEGFNTTDEKIAPFGCAVATGDVGADAGTQFIAFLKMRKDMPNVEQILLNPHNAPIPKEPSVLYMVCGALAHRAREDNIGRIIEYMKRKEMPEEFKVMYARNVSSQQPEVNMNKEFNQYLTEIESLY